MQSFHLGSTIDDEVIYLWRLFYLNVMVYVKAGVGLR